MTTKTNAVDTTASPAATTGALELAPDAGDIIRRIGAVESEWDDLDDLDLIPDAAGRVPFIKTNGNIDGGLYRNDEKVDEILCVIAMRSKSRAKFEKTWDEDKNARPECWSSNGLVPDATVAEPKHDKCATCPFSFEHASEAERKTACRSNVELLAYVPDENDIEIMRFRIGGISVKHAMRYWDSFRTRIPKKHPIGFVTKVTMVPEVTDNGNKLAVHFERVKELTREQAEVFIVDAKRRKAMWQQMIADDVVSADAQAVDGGDQGDPFADAPRSGNETRAAVDPETGEIIGATPAAVTVDSNGYSADDAEAPF
jgi:hypothetical protein